MISEAGRLEAERIARTFNLPLSKCLEAQARLEGVDDMTARATPAADMNAWIRGQTGRVVVAADAQTGPEQARKVPTANAGDGSRSTGPEVGQGVNAHMNAWIRSGGRG